MTSDIYNACRNGDIELVRALIETSPPGTEINRIEPNGSTALHAASYYGHADIVRLLLDNYGVSQDQKNRVGLTAYEEAATNQIRQLFHRSNEITKRFYHDENSVNPLEVYIKESQWLEHHSTDREIQIELVHEVFTSDRKLYLSLFDSIKSIFGNDPRKKKIEKWSTALQSLVEEYSSGQNQTSCANFRELLDEYVVNGEIEYLLRLYTLDSSFCQYLAQDQDKTNCLYAPILFNLSSVTRRAYIGLSFRGLSMTQKDLAEYERALNCHGSYIRTKTFCSSSADRQVAEMFSTDPSTTKIKVLMIFHFDQPCSTAIILFGDSAKKLRCISKFQDEQEILILPETIFSVMKIEKSTDEVQVIHLKCYDKANFQAELWEDRYKSYIDSFSD